MDGSVEIGAVRSGLLDEHTVARASTSFGRGQASLLYRVLLAVSQGDAPQLAACRRDPLFAELLTKALSARDRCESGKTARKHYRVRGVATDARSKMIDECILRIVRAGGWRDKHNGLNAVIAECECTVLYAYDRYKRLVKSGKVVYSQSRRMAVIVEEPRGPRTG